MPDSEGYAVRKALNLGPEADGADVLAEIGWLQESVRLNNGLAVRELRAFAEHAEREFDDDEERGKPYGRGVLDAAQNARRRAERLEQTVAAR